MPLVSTQQLFERAQKEGYAVGAFNAENMEMAQAIVAAATEMGAPVIVQTTPSTVGYANVSLYASMVNVLAEAAPVPVALHLDHGNSFDLAMSALYAGYSSLMIDGSHESFEDNIALSKKVVDVAGVVGIAVEAELGKVGGKEDDLDGGDGGYTDPEEAALFAKETGISSLAIAIGTAHGLYSGTPKLDIERLKEIRKVVSIPLVLHGASGLSDADIQACIREGICKVNFATELRIAYSDGVKTTLAENPSVFDPKVYGKKARNCVKELVMNRMSVCGCIHKYD